MSISTEEWIKMCYIYTMEYYSAIKRNKIPAYLAPWMDLEMITLSEVSHTMRHQHPMLSLTCGMWKKHIMNFFAEQILTHRLWKTYGFQRRQFGGWGDVLGLWDGNPIKLDCDDHCTTINVINSLSNKKIILEENMTYMIFINSYVHWEEYAFFSSHGFSG